jgi:hypothetical protein
MNRVDMETIGRQLSNNSGNPQGPLEFDDLKAGIYTLTLEKI